MSMHLPEEFPSAFREWWPLFHSADASDSFLSDLQVVYFGDSMHSDIFPARHYSNWETVLILEELRGDRDWKPEEAEPLEKNEYMQPRGKKMPQHEKVVKDLSGQKAQLRDKALVRVLRTVGIGNHRNL